MSLNSRINTQNEWIQKAPMSTFFLLQLGTQFSASSSASLKKKNKIHNPQFSFNFHVVYYAENHSLVTCALYIPSSWNWKVIICRSYKQNLHFCRQFLVIYLKTSWYFQGFQLQMDEFSLDTQEVRFEKRGLLRGLRMSLEINLFFLKKLACIW